MGCEASVTAEEGGHWVETKSLVLRCVLQKSIPPGELSTQRVALWHMLLTAVDRMGILASVSCFILEKLLFGCC